MDNVKCKFNSFVDNLEKIAKYISSLYEKVDNSTPSIYYKDKRSRFLCEKMKKFKKFFV